MLSKCALIIPTRNRPDFLERALLYYTKAMVSFPIFIGDSSDEAYLQKNIATIQKFEKDGICITHMIYPSETELLDKMAKLIDEVDYEFIKFAADDDFVSPDFMQNAAALLDTDSECSAVYGREIRFRVNQDACFGQVGRITYVDRSPVVAPSAVSRALLQSQQLLFTPVYNMKRRTLWRRIAAHFQEISKVNDRAEMQALFLDIIENACTVAAGNLRSIDDAMLIRQMHASAATNTLRERQDELSRMTMMEWQDLVSAFKNIVGADFQEFAGVSQEETTKISEMIYWSYVSRQLKGWVGRRCISLAEEHAYGEYRLITKLEEYWNTLKQVVLERALDPIRYRTNRMQFEVVRTVIERN